MTNTPNFLRGICLGKGSFGTVSLAVDKFDGDMFAVKSANITNTRFSQALENEIRILKSLSSPYVVKYRGDDVSTENSIVYRNLHMEYMPGGTVADLVKQGGDEYDDVIVKSYTRCIVSALSYIHERNISHCDVKGKNVLLGGIPGVAKLADFGSAMEMDGSSNGLRGSPLWMAPEVVRGEYQGPESDVWSLGCTVIEMITGQPAWQDRGVDTLCQIGYSNDLPYLPTHLSDDLRDFLSKCLRRNRSERWSCDLLLQHPFLLSCSFSSSEFVENERSPRCVFDWSDTNFSDDNSEIGNSNMNSNSSNAKQRIGEICSTSSPNWESDGWDFVRIQPSNSQFAGNDLTVSEHEMAVTLPEYSHSVENNDEELTVTYNDRTNEEYDDQCTNDHAEVTSSGWSSRDTDNNYSCFVYVSLDKDKSLLFNLNVTRRIYYKHLFLFNFKPISDLVSVLYVHIDCLPTYLFNDDFSIRN